MLLAINIGNSNTVVGLFDGDRLIDTLRLSTDREGQVTDYEHQLREWLDEQQVGAQAGVAICTVVPELEPVWRELGREVLGVEPLLITSSLNLNITFDYPNPAEIGADRICNAVAAFDRCGGPVVVVDLGTATTFEIVSAQGVFLGSVIAPGMETAQSALAGHAAQLFAVDLREPPPVIGKTTTEALQSGSFWGTVGQIDGVLERILLRLDSPATVIATGGLAGLVAPESRLVSEIIPELTLAGLRLIFDLNQN